jgi:hypothetical protein
LIQGAPAENFLIARENEAADAAEGRFTSHGI